MVSLSIEAILASLDKNSSLLENQPSSLDFLRGFDRDETVSEPRIMNEDIGYIKIHYFGRRTKADFAKAMISI